MIIKKGIDKIRRDNVNMFAGVKMAEDEYLNLSFTGILSLEASEISAFIFANSSLILNSLTLHFVKEILVDKSFQKPIYFNHCQSI